MPHNSPGPMYTIVEPFEASSFSTCVLCILDDLYESSVLLLYESSSKWLWSVWSALLQFLAHMCTAATSSWNPDAFLLALTGSILDCSLYIQASTPSSEADMVLSSSGKILLVLLTCKTMPYFVCDLPYSILPLNVILFRADGLVKFYFCTNLYVSTAVLHDSKTLELAGLCMLLCLLEPN